MILPASRSITDIKVDMGYPRADGAGLSIFWTDGRAERHGLHMAGANAREVSLDLHACRLISEGEWRAYLIGFIRHYMLSQGGG